MRRQCALEDRKGLSFALLNGSGGKRLVCRYLQAGSDGKEA